MENRYTCLWEFQVNPSMEAEFERHYGPAGTWAQLFRLSADYIETLLLKDKVVSGRYITVDRWRSEGGYLAFQSDFSAQYMQLDKACEHLRSSECARGGFGELPANHSLKADGSAVT